jgi:hypothetical protein
MILEYCEKGVLKEFLQSTRLNVNVDIEERLFRMVFGVCLGMDYLATQQVKLYMLLLKNYYVKVDDSINKK